MIRESEIETAFVRWCEKHDLQALKLVLLTRRGFPDRTIFGRGKVPLLIEFKTPTGILSSQQKWCIDKLGSVGYEVYVVDNVDDAIDLATEHFGL